MGCGADGFNTVMQGLFLMISFWLGSRWDHEVLSLKSFLNGTSAHPSKSSVLPMQVVWAGVPDRQGEQSALEAHISTHAPQS